MRERWGRMKTLVHLACALAAVFLCSACALVSSASAQRGRSDARADLRAGRLAIETFGLPPRDRPIYHRLLKERYGIEPRVVAGCIVNDSILGHVRGYNEVMREEIQRRFGANVFERTAEEARRIYARNPR